MTFDLSNYVDVAERIAEFRNLYPEGSLQSRVLRWPDSGIDFVAVEARAYRTPDDPTPGVGLAWEPFPGRTPYTKDSELQNAETSAWGRALVAVLAADTKRGVASRNEVVNRRNVSPEALNPGEQPDAAVVLGKDSAASGGTSAGGGASQSSSEQKSPARLTSPAGTPSAGMVPGEIPGQADGSASETPAESSDPTIEGQLSSGSEEEATGASKAATARSAEEAPARPVCTVNGAFHRIDEKRTAVARRGYVVCACGDAVPEAEAAKSWAEPEAVSA